MQTWKNATADMLYFDSTPADLNDLGYIVRLSDDKIQVTYDDDGTVCYRSKNKMYGNYELHAPERDGRASLNCTPNSHFLDGYGQQNGIRGMWRIRFA